jgi:hypothetical protein
MVYVSYSQSDPGLMYGQPGLVGHFGVASTIHPSSRGLGPILPIRPVCAD